ncbi:hypothetical protein BGX30_011468 [Mortierella sp. GBA39]|nr:hypothetical protein BGX30_011468 [Mortierella sp. GBA39]
MSGHYPPEHAAARHHHHYSNNSSSSGYSSSSYNNNINRYSTSSNTTDSSYAPPQRPQRARRPVPDPTTSTTSLGSSLSQISLHDNSSHSSLPINNHKDGRRVAAPSDKDLPEPPRPNRRLNRDFRTIPPTDEVETLAETKLQESIRQLPKKSSSRPPSVSLTHGISSTRTYQEPAPQLNDVDEDDEESYFGDILDKYCNSDDDNPSSPGAPSPIPTPDWRTSSNDQLPTPPSSRSSLLPVAPPPRRGAGTGAGTGAGVTVLTASLGQDSSTDSSRTRSRNNSASGTSLPSSSFTPSPVNPAKFKYLHAGPSRESHDSLSKLATPSASPSQSPASTTTRAYTKRPPPPPKDAVEPGHSLSVASASTTSQQSSHSEPWNHNNDSLSDLKDHRPEPPLKDSSRRTNHSNTTTNNNNYASNNRSSQSAASQSPQLSLGHHHQSSGHHIGSFADAVEATMNRHRAAPPVRSSHSGHSHSSDRTPSSSTSTTTRERSSSHGHSSHSSSHHGHDREGSGGHSAYHRHESVGPGHRHEQHGHSQIQERSRSLPPQARPDHHQSHPKSSQQHNYHPSPMQDTPYRMQGQGSSSQLDFAGSGYKSTSTHPPSASSRSSSQAPTYTAERTRVHSHAPVSTNGSSGRYAPSIGLKSALLKTPIARARAKEYKGPRKVIFGETITIVTIERTPTPPPLPPMDKKSKKKLLQSKKASGKDGKGQTQNFDPEYDARYYDAPYTPMPAEVVVTTAPWVGNPNWDEERQNSKFYYDDELDYEYDDYEYEAPHGSDIRLGPEDGDEDDEDEDEDEEEYRARPWGHGIAGPGGALPKKKGGMFKFKSAVNRLFLN